MDFNALSALYRQELLERVMPFWMTRSIDHEAGGFFTCLERDGTVYDTDKFVWLQGREVWMLATLYNRGAELGASPEQRQAWLSAAIGGADFLMRHGHDGAFNWYFSLTREGAPLVVPYNIFSYTFAVIAFGQLYRATGREEYARVAKETFSIVLSRRDCPKGRWSKAARGGGH